MKLSFDQARPNQPPYGYVIAIVRVRETDATLTTSLAYGADKGYGETTEMDQAFIFSNRPIAREVSNAHFGTTGKEWITYYRGDANIATRIMLLAVFLHPSKGE